MTQSARELSQIFVDAYREVGCAVEHLNESDLVAYIEEGMKRRPYQLISIPAENGDPPDCSRAVCVHPLPDSLRVWLLGQRHVKESDGEARNAVNRVLDRIPEAEGRLLGSLGW